MTVEELEATGSDVISDGEQTKPSFLTYPIHNLIDEYSVIWKLNSLLLLIIKCANRGCIPLSE